MIALGPPGTSFALRLLVLVALVSPHVAIWQVRHLPTQDGPLHVYNATLPFVWPNADASDSGAATHPRITAYLETRPTLASWLPQRMLGLAIRLAGIGTGERLFVSIYLILFTAGAWFVITGIRPENGILALLVAPLALNFPLHMGFYPFCASLPPTLFAVGFWVRANHRQAVPLGALSLVLAISAFCHPMGLAAAGVLTLVVSAGRVATTPSAERWRETWRELVPLALAALPGLAVFAGSMDPPAGEVGYLIPGPGRIVRRLTTVPDWVSYSSLEWVPAAMGVVVVVAIVLSGAASRWRSRSMDPADPLFLVAIFFVGLFVGLPEAMATGSYVGARMILWAAISAALWAGAVPHPANRRATLAALAAVGSILLALILGREYRAFDSLLAEHASAMRMVPAHSTLLALSTADEGATADDGTRPRFVSPFLHAAGAPGAGRDIVLLENYQAARPHFPVKFKAHSTLFRARVIDGFPLVPLEWPADADGPAGEYVFIWGPTDPGLFPGRALRDVLARLERHYDLVYVSQPRGLARLWRRR